MSVINKMLRDLDARRNTGRGADLPADMLGTSSVQGRAGNVQRHPRRILWALLVLLLAGGGMAYWVLLPVQPVVSPPLAAMPQPVAALPQENTAPAPESTASASVQAADAALVQEPPPPAVVPEPQAPAPRKKKRRDEAAVADAPPPTVRRERSRKPVPPESAAASPAPASAPAVVTPPAAVTPTPTAPAATAQRRQGAAQETLAQAQALWNAGSREAGLELVREGVAAAERAQPSDSALLALLVREQVRMELALGRPAAVLSLLTRLEPALAGQADLWAVRGNAAQRLGLHDEAVRAYLAALQLRPDEPRWMLGAAVSLAAQGQLDAAAKQAEQARALGPVSPDVLGYLRQAGVPLR